MAGRRSNGEGTIYRRKDGRYEGAAYFGTTSGLHKRIRVYGKTRQEVHTKLTEALAQSQRGISIPDQTWRLNKYLDYWLDKAVRSKRRPLTLRRHEAITRLYLKPELGHYTLSRLSVPVVQDFLDRLHADGKSPASIFQIRKVLSAALTYAMRQELVFRNVARLVELPSYKPGEAKYWSIDETLRFLEAARSDPLYPVFVLVTLYGLRRGEVLGLRWCDVDFDRGVLRIRQQIQRIDGALRQVPLKTDASERDEPLLEAACAVLHEQRAQQAAIRAAAGDTWQGSQGEDELVFTTKTGRPVESHNLYRSFLRICATHELRRITFHGLRHTNATTQKILDVHDRDIQAILGHGDVRTTGIYQHVDLDSKRRALEKVEQRLFEQTVVDGYSSRQKLPSNQDVDVVDAMRSPPKESTHLCWVGTFLGGSSQTRTGDTRLFSSNWLSVDARVTVVKTTMQARTRTWILGCVAVNLAVKLTSE